MLLRPARRFQPRDLRAVEVQLGVERAGLGFQRLVVGLEAFQPQPFRDLVEAVERRLDVVAIGRTEMTDHLVAAALQLREQAVPLV